MKLFKTLSGQIIVKDSKLSERNYLLEETKIMDRVGVNFINNQPDYRRRRLVTLIDEEQARGLLEEAKTGIPYKPKPSDLEVLQSPCRLSRELKPDSVVLDKVGVDFTTNQPIFRERYSLNNS